MAKRKRNIIGPDAVAQLCDLLAGGLEITKATEKLGIGRRDLYRDEERDPALRRRIHTAWTAGLRFRLDDAYTSLAEAKTRDQALIASKRAEYCVRTAELIAPAEYGRQASSVTVAANGDGGKMVIAWQPSPGNGKPLNGKREMAAPIAPANRAEPMQIEYEPEATKHASH